MKQRASIRYRWKIFFASTALLDIFFTFNFLIQNDSNWINLKDNHPVKNGGKHYSIINLGRWNSRKPITTSSISIMGRFFCAFCIVEATVRSYEARQMSLHNRALDELQQKMLSIARKGSKRISRLFGVLEMNNSNEVKHTLIDRWMEFNRSCWTWIPAIATFAFWIFLLPTEISDFSYSCSTSRLCDSAMTTRWLFLVSHYLTNAAVTFEETVEIFFWSRVMPFRIHKNPQKFIQRLQIIFKGIRFARFAGPLARMMFKLWDQIMTMWRARHESKKSDLRKETRIARPSLMLSDIRKLNSLAKVQRALVRIPSLMSSSTKLENISLSVRESYNKRRLNAKRIMGQISKLQSDIVDANLGSSEMYDRIIKTTNELSNILHIEKKSFSNRYLLSLRSFLSSRKYLISPRTRFNLAWRLTVTNCLLLEIFRLCASWHLSKTFSIPLSQVLGKLLIHCKKSKKSRNLFTFIVDQLYYVQSNILGALPMLQLKQDEIRLCIPPGSHALFILHFGRMLEIFIDVVVFLDIFVWFLTGDIDIESQVVVPKPFIKRCIIPGTLVQVCDHPTLPALLPNMLKSATHLSYLLGYSRCIRWILALAPAFKVVAFDPLKGFFFRHITEDKGLMHYAESVGILTPERKVFNDSTSSFSGAGGSNTFLHKVASVTYNNSSQVGLSLDASPETSYHDFETLLSAEEVTSNDGSSGAVNINPNSFPKARKSVHFDLDKTAYIKEQSNEGDFFLGHNSSESEPLMSSSPNKI